MSRCGFGIGVACLALLAACYPHKAVKTRFANDFRCKEDPVVRPLGAGAYRVTGCNQRATYVCGTETLCVREWTEDDMERQEQRQRSAPAARRVGSVEAVNVPGGDRFLQAHIGDLSFSLHLQVRPGKDNETVFVGAKMWSRVKAHENCALRMMVDGRLVEMGETGYRYDRGFEELRSVTSYEELFSMAEGSRVSGRVCDYEFRFDEARLQSLREFVVRIKEELVWREGTPDATVPAPVEREQTL